MPESRHKYLYERLGDHDFQLLVNALLSQRFLEYVPMPLRQSDGGVDGYAGARSLVYQVKWSAEGREKDPVAWLDATVRKEDANLRARAATGAKRYVLVTNVPGTARPGTGTVDRLDARLAEHSKTYGMEMSAFWRETVDAMTDSAPDATKWAYADMLAGWDLVRYLTDAQNEERRDRGLRDLMRKVAARQWSLDERLKFSQVDVDRERVADLFVDVTVDLVRSPGTAKLRSGEAKHVGGAAAHLLSSPVPFTTVRGAPGQGKSTLSQYVAQAFRAAFVPEDRRGAVLPQPTQPRYPIRLDLGDYAAWLRGVDVFADDRDPTKRAGGRKRPSARNSIECFLADLMTDASGGLPVSVQVVHDLLDRIPMVVVLDGLDEVGVGESRREVVRQIDAFTERAGTYDHVPKIVVTTRPSAGILPEPSTELYEVVTLNPLDQRQRNRYLRNWTAVRGLGQAEGQTLRNSFAAKSREPYIGELAGNPMQLTILLELLHKQGVAAPTARTRLYDAYMDLLLAREANKHPNTVRKYRDELTEVMPFLGWYLQSRSEDRGLNGRMDLAELKAAMRHFQETYRNPTKIVDELFEAATDRLWALTSKDQVNFEFEVVSLGEYFAARFLWHNAGEADLDFDRTQVLRELMRRPYWLNTARFYGGNARAQDIYLLAAGIRAELAETQDTQSLLTAWTLLTDGVFVSRPTEAAAVLTVVCADPALETLLAHLDRKDISPLPGLPTGPDDDPTWRRLTTAIRQHPQDPRNRVRARVIRELLALPSEFARWWSAQALDAVGTAEESVWLDLAAGIDGANGLAVDFGGASLTDGGAQRLLNTGFTTLPGGDLERRLVLAVLDGQCTQTASVRSLPAQIAVALGPASFVSTSGKAFDGLSPDETALRANAIQKLREAGSALAGVAARRRFVAGTKGSTFPWANTATALFDLVGRNWLSSYIAVLAASSSHLLGYTSVPGATAFGSGSHPGTLLSETRAHAGDAPWWTEQLSVADDDLARAEWLLALLSVASGDDIGSLAETWERVAEELPAERHRALRIALAFIGSTGALSRRPVRAAATSVRGSELLAARAQALAIATTPAPSSSWQPGSASLAETSKKLGWFLVDSRPTYR